VAGEAALSSDRARAARAVPRVGIIVVADDSLLAEGPQVPRLDGTFGGTGDRLRQHGHTASMP